MTDLYSGDISIGDVMALLPFSNTIEVLKATGRDIVQALEHGVTSSPQNSGRFPQVCGNHMGNINGRNGAKLILFVANVEMYSR